VPGSDGVARPQRVGSEDPAGAECVGEGPDAPVARPLVSGNTTLILFLRPFSPRSTLSTGGFAAISTATQARSRSRRAARRRRTDTRGRLAVRGVAKATQLRYHPALASGPRIQKIH
jgi:hypothetical protein